MHQSSVQSHLGPANFFIIISTLCLLGLPIICKICFWAFVFSVPCSEHYSQIFFISVSLHSYLIKCYSHRSLFLEDLCKITPGHSLSSYPFFIFSQHLPPHSPMNLFVYICIYISTYVLCIFIFVCLLCQSSCHQILEKLPGRHQYKIWKLIQS